MSGDASELWRSETTRPACCVLFSSSLNSTLEKVLKTATHAAMWTRGIGCCRAVLSVTVGCGSAQSRRTTRNEIERCTRTAVIARVGLRQSIDDLGLCRDVTSRYSMTAVVVVEVRLFIVISMTAGQRRVFASASLAVKWVTWDIGCTCSCCVIATGPRSHFIIPCNISVTVRR